MDLAIQAEQQPAAREERDPGWAAATLTNPSALEIGVVIGVIIRARPERDGGRREEGKERIRNYFIVLLLLSSPAGLRAPYIRQPLIYDSIRNSQRICVLFLKSAGQNTRR